MENLYLMVGLGNPGAEYAHTRHNAGFLVVEELARRGRADWKLEKKFDARVAKSESGGAKDFVGRAADVHERQRRSSRGVAEFLSRAGSQLLVVVDDADLPLGEIRLRAKGSSGGHHGLESIEKHIGSREFARLKVGIGRTRDGRREITGHVLGKFGARRSEIAGKSFATGRRPGRMLEGDGMQKAMNRFNGTCKHEERSMKRYEGLFILNTAAKEEGIKEIIDHISNDITAAGGKVETVQKMDKRPFSRIADKKHTSGFYVNIIFEAEPTAVDAASPEVRDAQRRVPRVVQRRASRR